VVPLVNVHRVDQPLLNVRCLFCVAELVWEYKDWAIQNPRGWW